jgi:hypothetical protein
MQSLTIFESFIGYFCFTGYYILSGVLTKDWQKHDKIRFVRWGCTARRQLGQILSGSGRGGWKPSQHRGTFRGAARDIAGEETTRPMNTRREWDDTQDEGGGLSMGRDPCCPPAPDPIPDAGAVFDEVESVVYSSSCRKDNLGCVRRYSNAQICAYWFRETMKGA